MKKFLFLASVGVGTIASVAWFTTTPRFALYSLGTAIESGDSKTALEYIDTAAISKQVADIAITEQKKKAFNSSQSSAEMLGATIAVNMIENMRSAIESKIEQQITERVTAELERKHQSVAGGLLLTDISASGGQAAAQITFPNGKKIPLEMKAVNGKWQVVGADRQTLELAINN